MGAGGGGNTTTSTQSMDPEIKKRILPVLDQVGAEYQRQVSGEKQVVEGLTPDQIRGLEAQKGLGQQALTGTGLYNTEAELNRALSRTSGQADQMASGAGALGSARSQAAKQGALANVALDDLNQRRINAQAGAQQIRGVGDTYQQQQQAERDAPHTAASRYFGYLTGANTGGTSTTSQGGGK